MKRILLTLSLLALTLPASAQQGSAQDTTPAQATTSQAAPPVDTPGVDKIFALQSNNTLLVYATPEGYAAMRSLVRHIDGQLDILRTDVAFVDISAERLKSLGIAPTDSARLLAAYRAGHLPLSDHVRLTTREDTPIDTLLHTASNTTLALSLVPREGDDGQAYVELMQPAVRPDTVTGSETLVAHLTGAPAGGLRLLFITPEILPSAARHSR